MKYQLIFLISVIFLVGSVAAQGCDSSGFKGTFKQGEVVNISVACTTCDFVNITTNINGSNLFSNEPMTQDSSFFYYTFSSSQTQSLGTYFIDGISNLNTPLGLCFDITPSGNNISAVQISIYIFFLLICLLAIYLSGLLIVKNPFSKDQLNTHKTYQDKKRNNALFYLALLKKKLWIVGLFGIYIFLILFLVILNQLFYNLEMIQLSLLLIQINMILLWTLIPFTIFWLGYLILYFYKATENIMRYQFGKLGEKQ